MKRAAAVCLSLLVMIAIPHAQGGAIKMDGYPEPGAPPIIKLLSAGDGPKAALRFTVPASYKEHADLATQMTMSMEMGGNSIPSMSVPTMTFGCDVAVTNIGGNGDISYTMVINDVTVGSDGDQTAAAAMQGMLGQMKGLLGTVVVSNRGITRSLKMDVSKGPPQLSQIMDSLTSQMQSLSMPLPEEEVGVGARWEVRQAMTVGGITTFQRAEYQIVTLDGKAVALGVKLEQTAPAQAISNPMLPAEMGARLLGMASTGTGTTTVHLDGIVPTGSMSATSQSDMEITMGGTTQAMSTKSSIKTTTTTKR